MDLAALLARLGEIDASLDALLAHDTFTDEQRAEHDSLVGERSRVVAQIDRLRDRDAREAQRAELTASLRQPGGRRTTDDPPPQPPTQSSPWANASTPRNFLRRESQQREPTERAYRFGMFARATLSRTMPGRMRSRYAEEFAEREFPEIFAAAHDTNDGMGTGYLIPPEFGSDMIVLRERYGVARRLFRVWPMSRETLTVPRWESGLTAYFVGEGAAITESRVAHDNVSLTARKLAAIGRWSSEVDMNSIVNFGDYLAGEIAYAFSEKEDQCAFNGDGTSTYGHIQGVRSKLTSVDGAGTDSAGLVTQGTGNTWGAIALADFHNVVAKLPQYADTPNAAWVCHKTFYSSVMQKLELAAGGVTGMEISSGDRRPRLTFLGYPVEFSQVFPSTTAATTVSCVLGDFARGTAFGDRRSESLLFSDQATVNGESLYERDQIAIRGTEHFDINVYGCGSSSAAGPIVGLATGA